MRLFGTAVLGVALAASQCAAQSAEQAPIQISRAETQHESLRVRNLSKKNKKKKHQRKEDTQTDIPTPTPIPAEEDEEYVKETRQNQPSCSICGDGMEVGNPDAGVSFPGQPGQIPCGVLENMGVIGLIPPAQCDVLPQLVSTVCECQSITPTTTGATAPLTTTEATKPGAKSSKSAQLSHSMSVPSKAAKSAAKSIQGKATSSPVKSGKSNKTSSPKGSKGQKMMPSKASSKAEKSASKGSKTAATTVDAKAQKVTTTDSSKAAKASTATETASTAASTPVSTSAAAAPVVASESAYLVPQGDSVRITCPAGGQCCVGGTFGIISADGDMNFETGGICGNDLAVTSGVLNNCSGPDDNCVVTCTGCDVEVGTEI